MPSRRDLANAIRALSMDSVPRANSEYAGAAVGMADIAELVWRGLKFTSRNAHDLDCDRFVRERACVHAAGTGIKELFKALGLTAERVVEAIERGLAK